MATNGIPTWDETEELQEAPTWDSTISAEEAGTPTWESTSYAEDPTETEYALDRYMYMIEAGSNITANLGYYAKSHLPMLNTEFGYDSEEGGVYIKTAEDMYGEDFESLTPQERRERMQQVDQARLQEKYAEAIAEQEEMAARGESDIAGTLGAVTKGILDPVALTPVGRAVAGIKTLGQASKVGAIAGAGWGGAYGASEQLAEKGAPTTADEFLEAAKRTGTHAAIGGVGGAVLGPAVYGVQKGVQSAFTPKSKKLLKTYLGSKKLGNMYYERVWNHQLQGKTAHEASSLARKELGMSTDDLYQAKTALYEDGDVYGVALSKSDAADRLGKTHMLENTSPNIASRGMHAINTLIRPIDAAIRDISPKLYTRLIGMEKSILSGMHRYHTRVQPFIKSWRRIPKAERRLAGQALYNNDRKKARTIFERNLGEDGARAFDQMVTALEDLGAEMKKAGIEFDGLDDYFPRMIKDVDKLKDFLHSTKKGSKITQMINQIESKKGVPLTNIEKVKLVNRYIEYGTVKKVKKSLGSTKQRKVETITDDMLDFYDDPITSIDLHIRDAMAAIERRKFFGKYLDVDEFGTENITKSVGEFLEAEKLDPDLGGLKDMLSARFGKGEQAGWRKLATSRQVVGGLTLGNPYSALRQFADTPAVMWIHGPINTLKGIPRATLETMRGQLGLEKRGEFNADAFGYMMEMAQELDTGGVASNTMKRVSNSLYKYGGFKTVDRFGKNVLMQAALNKARHMAKTPKGQRKFVQEYGSFYSGDELSQLMKDLAEGNMSDLVITHISGKVMDLQPISRSQMPQAYLNHPNGRALYQFRTWGLKQLELVRTNILRDLLSKDPKKVAKGAKSLALYTAYLGGANLGITEIQRVLTGRIGSVEHWEDIPEEVMWATLANIGVDRYGMEKWAEREDPSFVMKGLFYPPAIAIPAEMGTAAYKIASGAAKGDREQMSEGTRDLLKTTGLGRMIDWYSGGAEEFNEKERRRRLYGNIRDD